MKQPDKWRETIDPFSIQFNNFELTEVLGYPHARNDVFYCKGLYDGQEVCCFVKHARHADSDIAREISVINALNFHFLPQVLDFDEQGKFVVTKEVVGERLSVLLSTTDDKSIDYMFEYGKALAQIHKAIIACPKVAHRKFFDLPTIDQLNEYGIGFALDYLTDNAPQTIDECFCHGDFHYANILWNNGKVTAVLDWELSGIGNKEFDIAWAIINRPGQTFLNTDQEIVEFLKGYKSENSCDTDKVKYYMILIYCHFIAVGNNAEYKDFVRGWLKRKLAKGVNMNRIIRAIREYELNASLDFVEKVFTQSEDTESGKLVRGLLAEIRSKKYYVPELDLVMVNEHGEIVGQALFSRFHLDGKYENEMLLLSPVSVKTELQRQHISKDLIEFGLARAKQMGYKFCMVEGNPQNYRSRGFVTSAPYGITAHESVGLPAPECLMVQELAPNGLDGVSGQIDYRFYDSLK